MLICQHYIVKNILPPFLVVTFVITSLVWITPTLKLLYLIDKGVQLIHFCNLIILIIPHLLFIILPFVTVIAVIYTYHSLSEKRQLIILQSSGLNNIQLAKPALLIAFIVTLFAYYLSIILLPLSYKKLKADLNSIKNNYISNIIDAKVFNQLSKNIIVYVDRKSSDGTMIGVVLFDNRNGNNQIILFAKSGIFKRYDNHLIVQLNDGIKHAYDPNGNLIRLSFNLLTIELASNYNSQKLENIEYNRDVNEYYIHELLKPNNRLSAQRKIKLIVEGHQRLIWPLYNFIITFFSLAVFLKQTYNKGPHLKPILFISFSVIIITYLHFALQNLAYKDLNFIFACYFNIIITITISLYLYLHKKM